MASRGELLFGRIAIQRGYLSSERLEEALVLQAGPRQGVHLGRVLIEQGDLTVEQVKAIIEDQKRRAAAAGAEPGATPSADGRIGRLAVAMGFTTPEQVKEAVRIQSHEANRGGARKLGEILVGMRAISSEQLGSILKHQGQTALGDALPGYRIRKKVGEGGMASVYEAIQVSVNRTVAVKVLRPDLSKNPRAAARFLKEARTLGALDHPAIVRVYDAGQHGRYFFFAMEYVEGESLKSLIHRLGRLEEAEAVRIATAVGDALRYAHERGLIHRDVKPGNILLAADGSPKLCDLGIARVAGGGDTSIGERAGPVGTPFYMSPEQIRGRGVDIRADLYGLGATIYHMVVGEPPFLGANTLAILEQHLKSPPPSPRTRSGRVSEDLDAVVLKLLEKDPANRYAEPRDLLEDLRRLARGAPTLARRDRPVEAIPEDAAPAPGGPAHLRSSRTLRERLRRLGR